MSAWRPPAMTKDFSPRPCAQCRTAQHDFCNGDAWCEAYERVADCPCGTCYRLES